MKSQHKITVIVLCCIAGFAALYKNWNPGSGGNSSVIDLNQKHPNDRRVKRTLKLDNHLEILLISDPELVMEFSCKGIPIS